MVITKNSKVLNSQIFLKILNFQIQSPGPKRGCSKSFCLERRLFRCIRYSKSLVCENESKMSPNL